MKPLVRVVGLDHIVLMVDDTEESLAFYCGTLGLGEERVDAWRSGEVPFPSVRINATTIIDLFPRAEAPPPHAGPNNLDHFCLVIDPVDLQAVADNDMVEVVRGPQDHLFGAQGYATSLYVSDPDGNTVELRSYPTSEV